MRTVPIDLFDQRAIMDSDSSNPRSRDGDFGFAFNDSNFSDRLLRIEIVEGISDATTDPDGCSSIADWASHRKRRRQGIKIESVVDLISCPDEKVFNCTEIDADEGIGCEYHEEEPVPMIEESLQVEEITATDDTKMCQTPPAILTVKTLHISSPILAAKSPFFYKLFSNGMRESEQRHVTLRINASEEVALMELINFMYSNTLSMTTAPALLDVLLVADKFEVASCMRHCSRLLRDIPMTPESALLYLDLPSSVLMAEAVQPLTDAAKQYLAARYKDITKFQDEVLALPLAGIEAVLSSDELQVASEDTILDYVLKWARGKYVKADERREMVCTRLAHLVRFPHMSCRKLRKVLACSDFDKEFASKAVLEALFFKAEAPHRQRMILSGNSVGGGVGGDDRKFVERAYKYRPLKTLEFELPRNHCLVYLTLKREECRSLFPSGRVYSQAFHLAGQGFFLSAHCNMDQQSSFHCFGLFLGMQEKGSATFQVDYEFAARSNPTQDYLCKYKGNYTFTGGKAVGYRNLFGLPWTSFMADDSPFFISGVLHLRAELTVTS